jgi:putative intracellular protease/amidase
MKTKKRNCLMFVFEGYSDWEPSLAIAGLQQFTDFQVKTFSLDGRPVKSMGNLTVVPDLSLKDVKVEDLEMLLLPGGNAFDEGRNLEILSLVDAVIEQKKFLAAICGATGFLAQHHYLDEIDHTSNHLEYYLKKYAPAYRGDAHYQKAHAVVDGNILTANGTAIIEFAEAIFKRFDLLAQDDFQFWFHFFQERELALQ